MANTETEVEIDWTACELIESVPGKVSGRPIVRGTRILPDAIVGSYDLAKRSTNCARVFPALSLPQIKRLIEFAHAQRAQTTRESLLDENLDHALRKLLGPHEVVTVTYMGWPGSRTASCCGQRKKTEWMFFLPETKP